MHTRLFTNRKCCKAIMDDLLFFTSTKESHIANYPRNVSFLDKNYNIWVVTYVLRI